MKHCPSYSHFAKLSVMVMVYVSDGLICLCISIIKFNFIFDIIMPIDRFTLFTNLTRFLECAEREVVVTAAAIRPFKCSGNIKSLQIALSTFRQCTQEVRFLGIEK